MVPAAYKLTVIVGLRHLRLSIFTRQVRPNRKSLKFELRIL